MRSTRFFAAAALTACALSACTEPKKSVPGSMRFVLGGTSGAVVPSAGLSRQAALRSLAPLIAGDEYIVSPRKAKITFTSVVFVSADGLDLGSSTFADCTVTYDRSLASSSTLLDCPFTAPIGDVGQVRLYYDKTVQLLVSDATVGIYSDPASATGYSTTAPVGGAAFVPLTITIGDANPSRATPIIFTSPITIDSTTAPTLYVTVDMIHTVQMKVNTGGTTLTAPGTNDPVAVFGGLTQGSSRYYSGAPSAEGYKVQGVPWLRLFYDQSGKPIYSMIGPNWCGVDGGPKNAWASPPIGQTVGGWLGKDANNVIAWALATSNDWTVYDAYYVMTEATTVGQTTVLKCKVAAVAPPPADGKTYASGAPTITTPDKSVTLTLIAK
jgi:hypothetical protein